MPSPFASPKAQVATEIPVASVTVQISPGESGPSYNYTYKYDVLNADGELMERVGADVTSHITTGQQSQLKVIINAVVAGMRASLP